MLLLGNLIRTCFYIYLEYILSEFERPEKIFRKMTEWEGIGHMDSESSKCGYLPILIRKKYLGLFKTTDYSKYT